MMEFVRRAIRNSPAMNTLMLAIVAVGLFSVLNLRREVFPEFELEIILVTVPYPGASPEEVEEGICQKIEEAVRSIDGIKKQTAVAKEGLGSLVLELNLGVDVPRVLSEVRSEIDRIPSFPLLAEDPEVKQITLRQPAIKVGVVGPAQEDSRSELLLREITEQVREDLIRLPAVSQANITGAKEYQIDVEIPEATLRRHNLSLQQVARIIRSENLELPGGTIRTDAQDILVKSKSKGTVGSEIEQIPLITDPSGVVLTVGDLGEVRDEFSDIDIFTRINGQPGMVISVDRTADEDLLDMTDAIHQYVAEKQLPPGFELLTWQDRSVEVRDRINLLAKNGAQGLVLVLLVLALFLDLRLASWVAVGIPISILGACAALYFAGHTLNMLTTFTFVMALGIVVDDAIVIGENIYAHQQQGKGFLRSAIDGTVEVAPSVAASVATTIIAFVPLLFVSGVMGKFIAVMPVAMIAILLFSLFESMFVLPCHLAHGPNKLGLLQRTRMLKDRLPLPLRYAVGYPLVAVVFVLGEVLFPLQWLVGLFHRLSGATNQFMDRFAQQYYAPLLATTLRNPATAVSIGVALLLVAVGMVRGGIVPFVIFPKIDSNTIEASVIFPDGTPAEVTDRATRRLEDAIRGIDQRYAERKDPILKLTRRSVGYISAQNGPGMEMQSEGSHLGSVTAELQDTSQREVSSEKILAEWRELVGELAGAETVKFSSGDHGPGGTPIEFKLLASREHVAELEAAVERCKERLRSTAGVFDVSDDSRPGKWEFQLRVKPDAMAMGVPLQEVAETVRASYYGEEVMRLQRGRHEVKLMVRYPRGDRRSLAELDDIRVRAIDGSERPLMELADIDVQRSYSEVNRVDQLRSITISADLDENRANAREIVAELQASFMPQLLDEYSNVSVRWEGQQEQTMESMQSLLVGLAIALVAMFALLTFEFTSYFQPLLIMAIIPFGIVGAIGGHALLGLPLTLFSLFGLVTLTGIVVNDSIVLIDFINMRQREGMPIFEALLDAGRRRMRPIFLTSITTVAGLLPLLFETSFQAQILIPMAVSICFGLTLSTILVLFLMPTFYLLHARLFGEQQASHADELPEAAPAHPLTPAEAT